MDVETGAFLDEGHRRWVAKVLLGNILRGDAGVESRRLPLYHKSLFNSFFYIVHTYRLFNKAGHMTSVKVHEVPHEAEGQNADVNAKLSSKQLVEGDAVV